MQLIRMPPQELIIGFGPTHFQWNWKVEGNRSTIEFLQATNEAKVVFFHSLPHSTWHSAISMQLYANTAKSSA